MSGSNPAGDAVLITPAAWGQGERGAAGYEDQAESELSMIDVKPALCRDLMTEDPQCCLPAESAAQAAELMACSGFGVVFVVAIGWHGFVR